MILCVGLLKLLAVKGLSLIPQISVSPTTSHNLSLSSNAGSLGRPLQPFVVVVYSLSLI